MKDTFYTQKINNGLSTSYIYIIPFPGKLHPGITPKRTSSESGGMTNLAYPAKATAESLRTAHTDVPLPRLEDSLSFGSFASFGNTFLFAVLVP